MRLLSQVSREYKDTKYEKFWVVIPNDMIEQLNWKKGIGLKAEVKDKRLVITKE